MQDELSGPVDFSYLNHPITNKDKIFVKDAHFFRVGKDLRPFSDDDERVRFFGVNLSFGANFPEEKDAHRIANRLCRLGVNLVRLHHMDSRPDADPRTANSILTTAPYPTLNSIAATRLRRLISELQEAGIYVDLNLHVGYKFRPVVDGLKVLSDDQQMPRHSKPIHIFNERMITLQEDYTRLLISELKLNDNPVLAFVEINNESSLVDAWLSRRIPGDHTGGYLRDLMKGWRSYRTNYLSSADSALFSKSWAEKKNYLRYLVEMDQRYLDRIKRVVQNTAGMLVPVGGTQINFGGLVNIDSHVNMDFMDTHLYIDHYQFPNDPADPNDWRIKNLSIASEEGILKLANSAFLRVWDKPYTVTEFNQPWPNTHGAEINPVIAMVAAFQDWDAVVFYSYAHRRTWDNILPNGFNLDGDIAKLTNFGQAAWMFRAGIVSKGKKTIQLKIDEKERILAATRRVSGWKIYNFIESKYNVSPLLPLMHAVAIADGKSQVFKKVTCHRKSSLWPILTSSFTIVFNSVYYLDQHKRRGHWTNAAR